MAGFRNRKRTTVVTLVLIASVTLPACEATKRREVYRSIQDCQQEWGNTTVCEPIRDGSYPVGYYYGPYYRYSGGTYYYYRTYSSPALRVPNHAGIVKSPPGRSNLSVGRVSRGGFGSSSFGRSSS